MRLPKHTQGFTLLELMFVVTAATILVAIALGAWRSVAGTTSGLAGDGGLAQIVTAVRTTYSRRDYTGLSSAALIKAGGVPSAYIDAAGNLVSAWGSKITLQPMNVGAGATYNAFRVTIPAVPRGACTTFLVAAQSMALIIIAGDDGTVIEGVGGVTDGPIGPGGGVVTIKDETATPPVAYSVSRVAQGCAAAPVKITLTMS